MGGDFLAALSLTDTETNNRHINYFEWGQLADTCFIGNVSSVGSLNVVSNDANAERG